jgi:hypothetical protein
MTDFWTPDRRRSDRRVMPDHYQARLEGMHDPMRVRELGPRGIVVESGRPLTLGDAVRVVLGAAGSDGIGPLQGRVAHSRMLLAQRSGEPPVCLTGIAFDQVRPEHAARIAAVLAEIDGRQARRSQDAP